MREIKFRAWHKETQRMATIDALDFMLDSYRAHVGKFSGSGHLSDIELMQFTGLKDKHGKEVYEGDIVRINHPQDMTGDFTNALGEVFWWNEQGAWYHGNQSGRPPKRMWNYCEVIGNIYEHPELVKD